MNLTEHLEHVIGLVESGEPPAKIKAGLVAMSEEVSGYEHAAKAIQLAEKKPAIEALSAPETTARLGEILNAIQTSKANQQATEDKLDKILARRASRLAP